ncbi:unnamed protein product, partial [Cladocopium goreaui]
CHVMMSSRHGCTFEDTLASELRDLHSRLLQQYRQDLEDGAHREFQVSTDSFDPNSVFGPKLDRSSKQGRLCGDKSEKSKPLEPLEQSEHFVETAKSSAGSSDFECTDEFGMLKSADQAETILQKWGLLGLHLMEVQAYPRRRESPSMMKDECKHELKMHTAWTQSLRESSRFMRSRTLVRGVSKASRINEKVLDHTSCLQPLILGPQNPKRLFWTFFGFLFILWDLVTIPMQLFDIPGFSGFLDLFAEITFYYWVCDIFLNFIFSFERQGQLEMRPRAIAMHYLRSWFPLDCLVIGIDIALRVVEAVVKDRGTSGGLQSVRLLRALRLLRLMRLLRVGKLKQAFAIIASRFTSLYFLMIMKVLSGLGMILVVNHYIACFWYGLGLVYHENSWLQQANVAEGSFSEGYISALHWSLTQFTPATNNISPENVPERLYAVFVILLALGVFSSFISSITSAVNTLRAVRMEQMVQESKIRQFFNERQLSAELFNKIQEVCRKRRLFEIRLQENEVRFLAEIPDSVKARLHEEIFLPWLLTADFLPAWCLNTDHRFLRKVCHLAMRECYAVSTQDVFNNGLESTYVIIVQHGSMGYYVKAQDSTEFDVKERWTVKEGTFLCVPTLFASWYYRGKLNADRGSCYYVSIESSSFCGLAQQHAGALYQYMRIYGMLLINVIEARDLDRQEVSDLDLPRWVLDDIRDRTQRFADALNSTSNSAIRQSNLILNNNVEGKAGFYGSASWNSEMSKN